MKLTEYEKTIQTPRVNKNGYSLTFDFFNEPNTIRVISAIPKLTINGLKIKVAIKTTISPRLKNNQRISSPSRIKTKKSPKNTKTDPASG